LTVAFIVASFLVAFGPSRRVSAGVHQPGGVLDGVLGPHGHRRARHQVARDDPARLLLFLAAQCAGDHPRHPLRLGLQGFLGQQVGLGDDADHLAALVKDGERADPMFA
jgi:hypothetical protein